MNIQKMIVPAAILVLFLIIGVIVLRWSHVGRPPKSEVLYKIDRELEKKTASQVRPAKPELGVIVPPPPTPSVREEPKPKEEPAQKILPKSEGPVKIGKEIPKEVPKEIPKEMRKEIPQERTKIASAPSSPSLSPAEKEPKPEKGPVPQVVTKSEAPVRVEKEVPKEVPREVPKEAAGAALHPEKKMAIKTEEEKRLAKEEEVKQFFSSYIDRYHRKDIDGFLSFFSSKAVQNQKDGLKGIRSIYTKFFDQSEELRYRMEEMKIEIYQNAVEVKARFRVDQTLKRRGEGKVWTGAIQWVLVKEDGALKIISLNYQNQKSP